MRFGSELRRIREAKRRLDPTAYTQEACGSRVRPEPIGQSAWSQREKDNVTQPDYKTVLAYAEALRLNTKETEDLLKAAGYDVRKQLRIAEVQTLSPDGEIRDTELSPEDRRKLEDVASQMQNLLREVSTILNK
jgi:hypothetical protein